MDGRVAGSERLMSDTAPPPEAPQARDARWPRGRVKTAQAVTVALIVAVLLIAVFVIQNTQSATIEFLFWSASVAVAGALLLAAGLGAILGFSVAYLRYRQFRSALKQEQRHSS